MVLKCIVCIKRERERELYIRKVRVGMRLGKEFGAGFEEVGEWGSKGKVERPGRGTRRPGLFLTLMYLPLGENTR